MSKATDRKFRKAREEHYAYERQVEAERAEARLKGFKPATSAEMTGMILGTPPEPQAVDLASIPRHQRRRLRLKRG